MERCVSIVVRGVVSDVKAEVMAEINDMNSVERR